MIRRIVCALALVCALPAVRASSDLSDFTADNLESDLAAHETVAQGHARLKDKDVLITSDEMRYNNATDTVTATGHVVLNRGADRLLADVLVYRRSDGTFTAKNIRFGHLPYYIAGDSAEGTAKEITVHDAKVSYGEPGPFAPSLHASTVVYSPGHYLRLGFSKAGVGAAEIIPVPRFEHALLGSELFPYVSVGAGYRSNLGATADLGVHVPVAPDVKVGGDIGVYTQRGIMAGPSGTYQSAPAADGSIPLSGSLQSGFIEDRGDRGTDILGNPVPEDRGFVDWQHQQQIADNLNFDGSLYWWKDSEVLRDFRPGDFYPVQEPDTYLESVYSGQNYLASAFARFQPDSYEPVQERVPELRYDLVPTAIGGGFYQRFDSSIVSLAERPPGGGQELSDKRFDAFYEISYPWSPTPWLDITPVAGTRLTDYSDTVGAAVPGGYTRTLGELGFDADLRSSGTFDYKNQTWDIDGLRHLFTPVLSYRYIPDADAGQSRIPDIDSQTFTPELTPIELGDLRSIDNLNPVNTLRFGVDNTLQTRNQGYGSRDLLTFNVTDDMLFARQAGEKEFSDIHTSTLLTPAPWVSFDDQQIFAPQTFTLEEEDAGINLNDGDAWSLRLAGDFLRHEDDDYLADFRYRLNEVYTAHFIVEYGARQHVFNQTAFILEQKLANAWTVRYLLSYSPGPNPEGKLDFTAELDLIRF